MYTYSTCSRRLELDTFLHIDYYDALSVALVIIFSLSSLFELLVSSHTLRHIEQRDNFNNTIRYRH